MAGTAFSTSNWTGYDEATVTNPASALTDFSLLIDISTFSSTWKSEIQSDGADIRCTKGDNTEIPLDVIDFAYNAGAPTGKIRCKWSGSLASSGTQKVRVWAGYTGGTAIAYDATETYGSDNAYVSALVGYWPLSGDFTDRTSNGNDGTGQNGISAGGVSGKVTNATDFDATSDQYVQVSASTVPSALQLQGGSIFAWISLGASPESFGGIILVNGSTGFYSMQRRGASDDIAARHNDGTTTIESRGGTLTSTIKHYAIDFSATDTEVYENDTSLDADMGSNGTISYSSGLVHIGDANGPDHDGTIEELMVYSSIQSDAWRGEEYSQSNSQSTFWGTWAWTAAGGGDPEAMVLGGKLIRGGLLMTGSLVRV